MSMIYELQSYELLSTKHHITLLIFVNCILFVIYLAVSINNRNFVAPKHNNMIHNKRYYLLYLPKERRAYIW